jgi:hypothetical protein
MDVDGLFILAWVALWVLVTAGICYISRWFGRR